jgi:hypothetical protein
MDAKCRVDKYRPFLSFLVLCLFLSGCSNAIGSHARVIPPPHADERPRFVHPGMNEDDAERTAGEPHLIVNGIPTLTRTTYNGHAAIEVELKDRDQFETWYYSLSKIDTLHSSVPVTLYGPSNDEYVQHTRLARLEYDHAIVIAKNSHTVVRVESIALGFIDKSGDIQIGAQLETTGRGSANTLQ